MALSFLHNSNAAFLTTIITYFQHSGAAFSPMMKYLTLLFETSLFPCLTKFFGKCYLYYMLHFFCIFSLSDPYVCM